MKRPARAKGDASPSAAQPSAARWRAVAIYIRVSTGDQTHEQQEEALRRWVGDRAAKVVVFAEKESSGKARPVYEEMLRRARRREFDAVVVWAFSRFARTSRELILWLDESDAMGIRFLSMTENLDTSTPLGRAMFAFIAAMAELERGNISQRTKLKLAHLKAMGVKLGRPRIAIDEVRARRLVLERKLSVRKLARALGISQGTAARERRRILACQKGGGPRRPPPAPRRLRRAE